MNKYHKPKYPRIDTPNVARFLTFGCFHKKHLFRNPEFCKIFLNQLDKQRNQGRFEIWAYVIMANHVHLLLYGNENFSIRQQIGILKRRTSAQILDILREANSPILRDLKVFERNKEVYRVWQKGGGYDRNLRKPETINRAIKYIHNNPARNNLVECITDYQWSSAKAWHMGVQEPIAINPDSYVV